MTTESPAPAARERQPERAQPSRPGPQPAGKLVSVNVGLPKDVSWQGRTVFTGVFKDPVTGPRRVRRLNVDGDGQGDLSGHGGEQRAVFVYQMDSYRYWERELGRSDFVYGQFGENFTVEGLTDAEVCIGDRYRIGGAVFEVTQPRVTCYRVGIRMNEPRIPALLVSHHRPGFYFRVLRGGRGAGRRRDHDAEAYLCGPAAFMDDISAALAALGVDATHIRTEPFGPAPSVTPGIAATPARAPHPPAGQPGHGPSIAFARSDLTIPWSSDYGSLLEFASACDVPVRWSCRTGVCQTCETTVLAGHVDYSPDPVEPPPEGSALLCCSQPHDDLVLDL